MTTWQVIAFVLLLAGYLVAIVVLWRYQRSSARAYQNGYWVGRSRAPALLLLTGGVAQADHLASRAKIHHAMPRIVTSENDLNQFQGPSAVVLYDDLAPLRLLGMAEARGLTMVRVP